MSGWLFEARIKQAMSSKEVASAAGVSYKSYNAYENGRRRPSPETAKKIAAVLGFSWTQFFENEEQE